MGVPKKRWMVYLHGKSHLKFGWSGGSPISGNWRYLCPPNTEISADSDPPKQTNTEIPNNLNKNGVITLTTTPSLILWQSVGWLWPKFRDLRRGIGGTIGRILKGLPLWSLCSGAAKVQLTVDGWAAIVMSQFSNDGSKRRSCKRLCVCVCVRGLARYNHS